jgi:hypothetical protein
MPARRKPSLLRRIVLRTKGPATLMAVAEQPAELADAFGMVIRDPFYEWNRNELYPQAPNYQLLTEMAANLYALGVRWVRIEFQAEEGGSYGAIDYRKFDWFINVAAPRFGLKVLGLFSAGILRGHDADLAAFQNGGAPERQAAYIAAFADRVTEIASRYRDKLHGYEIWNEPNKFAGLAIDTQGEQDEISPEAFGALMSALFPRLKAVQDAPVVVGGLLTGENKESRRDARGYLRAYYDAPAVRDFRAAQSRWPHDAIGLHPYRDTGNDANTAEEVLAKLDAVYAMMQEHGDAGAIWITEIGMEAGPPSDGDGPSDAEIRQANFLNGVYSGGLGTRRAFLQRIFWFKYEDFWMNRDETWGVVRLAARQGTNEYDSAGVVTRRRAAFEVYSGLTPPIAPLTVEPPSAPTNLEVEVRKRGEVHFTWQAGIPATHRIKEHQLFRSASPDMRGALHVASLERNLDVLGRAPRGTHYYAIRAVDSAVPPNASTFSNVVKVTRLI